MAIILGVTVSLETSIIVGVVSQTQSQLWVHVHIYGDFQSTWKIQSCDTIMCSQSHTMHTTMVVMTNIFQSLPM